MKKLGARAGWFNPRGENVEVVARVWLDLTTREWNPYHASNQQTRDIMFVIQVATIMIYQLS